MIPDLTVNYFLRAEERFKAVGTRLSHGLISEIVSSFMAAVGAKCCKDSAAFLTEIDD